MLYNIVNNSGLFTIANRGESCITLGVASYKYRNLIVICSGMGYPPKLADEIMALEAATIFFPTMP